LSYKISLVVVFKQEDGLANSFDDIQIKITANSFNEVRVAALKFMQEYNEDPTNRARIYDWYVAESEDLLGLGGLDMEEEEDD
jgi:hypothetical protein